MNSLSTFAVIFDEESRVLLCHRTDMDAWNLPGGGVEGVESPWDAVVREVMEEVGLEVRVERLIGIYSVPEQQVLACTFLCVPIGGNICFSAEADDIRWFTRDSLPPSTLPRHIERVNDAYSTDGVFMRVQAQQGAPGATKNRRA
ncbi:MAG: NUDIX domain-containing protein [Sulfuriferula sp.]